MIHVRSILPVLVLLTTLSASVCASSTSWAVDFSEAIIRRWPNSINDMTHKGWEYSNAIVLQGIERTYAYTKTPEYLAYIKKYVDQYVDANGNVPVSMATHNLDALHPGILCLFLYQETGQRKYRTAATKIFEILKQQPTNPSGGFWHKSTNANHMLLDGIYMAHPFLVKYGYRIGERHYCDSVAAFQILLLASHVYVPSKKLLLHGWDETKQAVWADKSTGLSSEIWSRAMGWFSMALVEVLKYFPKDHPKYPELLELLGSIAEGIKNAQDGATGLWYQVVDKGDQSGNWLESSGSGMMIYALKTAVDCGFIDQGYRTVAQKGWEGLKSKITLDNRNMPVINQFVGSMNVLPDYAAYVSKEKVNCPPSTHPHGYCGVLSGASAMELAKPRYRLTIMTSGPGSVLDTTGELFHDSGTTVSLTAVAQDGCRLVEWSGAASGSDTTAAVLMDEEKTVTATFNHGTGKSVASLVKESDFELRHCGSAVIRVRVTVTTGQMRQLLITVFNCRGEKVHSSGEKFYASGEHLITFNTHRFAPGAYIIRLRYGDTVHDLQVILSDS